MVYGLDDLGPIPSRDKIFLDSIESVPALGSYPTSHPMAFGGRFPSGVKLLGCEGDHSPKSSAEVKNMELYLHSAIYLHDIVLY
jgi:hypothetical protein